jgi:hypothetical protein
MGPLPLDHGQRFEDVQGSSGELNVRFGREYADKPLRYDRVIVDDCYTDRRFTSEIGGLRHGSA